MRFILAEREQEASEITKNIIFSQTLNTIRGSLFYFIYADFNTLLMFFPEVDRLQLLKEVESYLKDREIVTSLPDKDVESIEYSTGVLTIEFRNRLPGTFSLLPLLQIVIFHNGSFFNSMRNKL